MFGDVIIIAVMLVLGAAVVALWIKKEEYKDESGAYRCACSQLQKGAEIQAKREVVRKQQMVEMVEKVETTGGSIVGYRGAGIGIAVSANAIRI